MLHRKQKPYQPVTKGSLQSETKIFFPPSNAALCSAGQGVCGFGVQLVYVALVYRCPAMS